MRKLITIFAVSFVSFALLIILLGDQYQQVSFKEAEQKLCNKERGEILLPYNQEHFPLEYACSKRLTKKKFIPEKISLRSLDVMCKKGAVMTYDRDEFSCKEEFIPEGRYSFPENIL